jgi:hypothetical protein
MPPGPPMESNLIPMGTSNNRLGKSYNEIRRDDHNQIRCWGSYGQVQRSGLIGPL